MQIFKLKKFFEFGLRSAQLKSSEWAKKIYFVFKGPNLHTLIHTMDVLQKKHA